METFWTKVDAVLQGIETGWQLVILAAVLASGYVLRWLVERHTLEYQHRQKINETLAEKLHEYSVEHYVPTVNLTGRLCYSLEHLAAHLKPAKNGRPDGDAQDPHHDGEELSSLTFNQPLGQILAILSKNRHSGAYFFRSLRGEEVVCFILNCCVEAVTSEACLTRRLCTKILDEHHGKDAPDFFQRPLTPAMDDAIKRFATWARQETDAVHELRRQLRCFRETLLFEINVSHRGWYRRRQRAELGWDELSELSSLLQKLEDQRIQEGRRWKLWAYVARKAYLYRVCGLRGLLSEKRIRSKAEQVS